MEQPVLPPVTLAELDQLSTRASTVINRLRDRLFAPGTSKTLDLRFTVRKAAQMIGRSDKLIRDAEADGRLPMPEKDPETGRRTGYNLAEVNEMRRVFGTLPHRSKDDPPWFAISPNISRSKGIAFALLTATVRRVRRVFLALTPISTWMKRRRHSILSSVMGTQDAALRLARHLLARHCA